MGVGQQHLQAVHVVGAEQAEDLRVGVLAEPDALGGHIRRAGRGVVVDPEDGVAVGGRDEAAQGRRVPEAEALAEEVQDSARETPHCVHVLVHCYTAAKKWTGDVLEILEPNHHKRLANSCKIWMKFRGSQDSNETIYVIVSQTIGGRSAVVHLDRAEEHQKQFESVWARTYMRGQPMCFPLPFFFWGYRGVCQSRQQ